MTGGHAQSVAMTAGHAQTVVMIGGHVLQAVVTVTTNVRSVMTARHASVTAMGMNASPLPTNRHPYAGKAADRQDAAGGAVLRVADVLDQVLVVDAAWAVDAVERDSHRRLDLSGNETPTSTDLRHMLQTSTCSRRTLTKTNLRNARCEAAGRSLHPTVKLLNRSFCHNDHGHIRKAVFMKMFIVAITLACLLSPAAKAMQKDTTDQLDSLMEMFFDDHPDRMLRSRSPRLQALYGTVDFSRKGLTGTVNPIAVYGASVGMEDSRSIRDNQSIVRYQNNGLFFNYGAAKPVAGLTPIDDSIVNATTTSMNLYTFGFIDESGYGYKLGSGSALKFLVAKKSVWSSVDPISFDNDISGEARQTIRDFTGNIRFGAMMSPTIEFQIIKPLSVRASYTWSQIYPRHMFWYWGGSELIEGIADGIVMASVKAFGKASPSSLPIMNFVLRNAVAYGFKTLRKNQMNWPFETAAPMNVTGYSLGVSLNF
jgi:hypothetical protein